VNALIISDLHAHTAWPFSRRLENGRPSRFQDLLNVLAQVDGLIEEYRVTDLLILGDLTHRRHFINFALYNTLMASVAVLARKVRKTHILVGNHDYETNEDHSLYPFAYLPNTNVYDRPELTHLSTGEPVMMIPYLHDSRAVSSAFEKAPSVPVFSHYAAEGAPLETDWWLESPVKLGELARFPQVVFGHVHKPSEQLDGQVIYVGAPMHFDFGDAGPRRCLRLLDGGTTKHMIPLVAPVFQTVKWPRLPAPTVQGYLRVLEVPSTKELEAREVALKMGWLDVVTLREALPPEVRAAVSQGLVLDENMLRAYVKRQCSDLPAEEQEALVQEGLSLLKVARG
jgi:DNA repair exonuclease SbcCD nuclease subunit